MGSVASIIDLTHMESQIQTSQKKEERLHLQWGFKKKNQKHLFMVLELNLKAKSDLR